MIPSGAAHLDPVIAAAIAHYQFETPHPFRDGNGRAGRLMIVLHLQSLKVLSEPTLTVSPWFEARRDEYYDRLLSVSTDGDWDGFVEFFARGIQQAAVTTEAEMIELTGVQEGLKGRIIASSLRTASAHRLVDFAVGNPSFSVRHVESELGLTYTRANHLVGQLVDLGVLEPIDDST